MNSRISKGVIANFVATIVLSAMMILKSKMGLMPHVNAIKMLATMAHGILPLDYEVERT